MRKEVRGTIIGGGRNEIPDDRRADRDSGNRRPQFAWREVVAAVCPVSHPLELHLRRDSEQLAQFWIYEPKANSFGFWRV